MKTALAFIILTLPFLTFGQDCLLTSFTLVHLNTLGPKRELRADPSSPPASCQKAMAIDVLVSSLKAQFKSFKVFRGPLFLVNAADDAITDEDYALYLPLAFWTQGKSLARGSFTRVLYTHEFGHLLFFSGMKEGFPDLFHPDGTRKSSQEDRAMLYQILAPMSEFFADAVAVIAYRNPKVMATAIAHIDGPRAQARDFSDVSNRSFKFNREYSLESHGALGPARYELHQQAFSKGNFDEKVLDKVLQALKTTFHSLYKKKQKISDSWSDAEIAVKMNKLLIKSLKSRF